MPNENATSKICFLQQRGKWVIFLLVFMSFFVLYRIPAFSQTNNVRINEFMALNQTTIVDKDNDDSDWIELYNPTGSPVNLEGWALTDQKGGEMPTRWYFPAVTIQPDGYLLLFASGKDRNVAGKELHTSFRLSGSGEYLALFDAGGTVVTAFDPAFPEQVVDVSYGYFEADYIFLTEPTPGAVNKFSDDTQLLPLPMFSHNHGFYDEPFGVTLTSELQNADIYYTTNGNTPTPETGMLYTSPVQITTTTVLRAIASKSGGLTSRIATQSYIFVDDVLYQSNNPAGYPAEWGPYTAMGGNAIADYEMDPDIVEDGAYSGKLREALLSIPTISIVTDIDNLFSHSEDPETGGIYIYTGPPITDEIDGLGAGWERPASVEFINADGTMNYQVNCGIRLQGGHSRRPEKSPKHSFRLCFRSKYGAARLEYPLFGDEAASEFNTITLRGGFCNAWHHHAASQREIAQYIRDPWAKDTQLEMGHLAGHGFFAHVYLNGLYWGVYNPTERMDSDFASSYLEGNPEDFDLIKDYTDVVDGEIDSWREMMNMADGGLDDTEAYQRIQGNNPDGTPNPDYEPYVDVVNLIDYMIINFYGGNTDWDHHNWAATRNRRNPGKGFKFICWDEEHILEQVSYNFLDEFNNDCPSDLFQNLRQNADFRRLFADRIQLHCFNGGALTPEATSERWMKRANELDLAIIAESARWGDYRRDVHQYQAYGPFTLYTKNDHWLVEQSRLLTEYFPYRTSTFISQLQQASLFPQVSAASFVLNGKPVADDQIVALNDELSIIANSGTIYFTTNGNDPLLSEASKQGEIAVLVRQGADKRVLVPHASVSDAWRSDINFDDSAWRLCSGTPGGVGYEKRSGYESLISLDVGDDMHNDGGNPNPSCFIRIPFTITKADLEKYKSLVLAIRYDDGYAAYLNGAKVASANTPATLSWNSSSNGENEADSPVQVDISAYFDQLIEGANLLAIHGLNANTSSSDFVITAQLNASEESSTGDIAPGAEIYTDPIVIKESTKIKTRVLNGSQWSALSEIGLIIPSDLQDLKITEIHYHPQDRDSTGDGQYEFVELKNIGSTTLNLSNAWFCNGISYTFPVGTKLKPQEFVVLASNHLRFLQRYDIHPFDEYEGNLDNAGERLVLVDADGDTVFSIRYNDKDPWPTAADGDGYSLVTKEKNPTGDLAEPENWRASNGIDGSPGKDDDSSSGLLAGPDGLPQRFRLNQNYPNPFNNSTMISYHLPVEAQVTLTVCDILGRKVKTIAAGKQAAGTYQVAWHGVDDAENSVASGIYFFRIQSESQNRKFMNTKKMVLLK